MGRGYPLPHSPAGASLARGKTRFSVEQEIDGGATERGRYRRRRREGWGMGRGIILPSN